MSRPANDAELRPSVELEGKNILLSGTTGFLGKVVLAMLLVRYPGIKRIYALIRPGVSEDARDRFNRIVATSPALRPLVETHGDNIAAFLDEKVVPVDGNIIHEHCGIAKDTLALLEREKIDVIINSAGLVDFDPPLDEALGINAVGIQHVVDLAKRLDAALVHVSTCFVAGRRQGQILEDDPIVNQVPLPEKVSAEEFDYRREIERLQAIAEHTRAQADDQAMRAKWRAEAREVVREEGRDPEDESAVKAAMLRLRKKWLTKELRRVGMERADFWGWTNTYTFTKHLGEQIIADAEAREEVRACIVRPAIVESAFAFPFPGWNEGFTTSGPLVMLSLGGLPHLPYEPDLILDIVPVDMVAGVIIAAAASLLAGPHKLVYQVSTGDVNPLTQKHGVEITALHTRQMHRRKKKGGFKEWWLRHNEMRPITKVEYYKRSVPRYHNLAKKVVETVDALGPDRFAWVRGPAASVRDVAAGVAKGTGRLHTVMEVFMPFIAEQKYVFRGDNSRHLMARVPPEEAAGLHYNPAGFTWRDYWLNIHVPGLEKWVFPKLERELAERPKQAYVFRTLVELFETTTHRHRHRVALQYVRRSGEEYLTYGQLRTLAFRVAGYLAQNGVEPDDRVVLVAENRPEWVAAYFGILLAGATAVPVDAMAKANEIVNITKACGAKGLLISQRTGARLVYEGADPSQLSESGAQLWFLPQAVCHKEELPRSRPTAQVASIIFTSGTTGKPKGVMLTHKNFTFEVSRMLGVFNLNVNDHLLSVLPLHHTFEFSAGLLAPLARGSRITYISELTPKNLSRAMGMGITSLIGVPALWQLLQRRIEGQIEDAGALPTLILKGAQATNAFAREYFDLNLGVVLAYPVHRALGGRLKYLVSGGSALSPEVMDFFRSLGFNLTEGYGLTEAAPVLTVTDPKKRLKKGSVGKALPGVELKIHQPNEEGIGEVLARGPNVMLGYYGDREATEAAIDNDGWLHTGDLGYLDSKKRLYLVGRSKDVIVDLDGKNAYPDELEELYAGPCIKEISVVGLPREEAKAERVAALVVPDYGDATGTAEREEIRQRIHRHLRKVGEGQPHHRRIKVAQLWDGELPRTATRKIKRSEVLTILQRLLESSHKVEEAIAESAVGEAELAFVRRVVHALTGRPKGQLTASTRLDQLGLDSLMQVELASALEERARGEITAETLMGAQTLGDVVRLLERPAGRAAPRGTIVGRGKELAVRDGEQQAWPVPAPLVQVGKRVLSWGQKQIYHRVMDMKVAGQGYIPRHSGFLVAANHTSHLDAGLAKMALGVYGRNLVTLAAKDYFFGNALRRTYFENFTNVLPIERHGAAKQDLRRAVEKLSSGHSMLLFPEGTRSVDGELQPFKSSLGYLALAAKVPVLPMYLWGTYEAMPKGSALLPSARRIGAVMGPALGPEVLAELGEGRSRSEAYRMATEAVERAVAALRDRGSYTVDEILQQVRDNNPAPRDHAVSPEPSPALESSPVMMAAEGARLSEEGGSEPAPRVSKRSAKRGGGSGSHDKGAKKPARRKVAGKGGAGKDSVGKDSVGKDNVGKDNVGKDNVGKDSAGKKAGAKSASSRTGRRSRKGGAPETSV